MKRYKKNKINIVCLVADSKHKLEFINNITFCK